ncbi:MAG: helix-turn-helix transcriptional regulator [Planctomycetes bacterium]|uniref:PadR family transcriptional regulator n=1 Tax=Candidatus Wunengus sp. YC65 TaxID=3367701 RepID=UPI001D760AF7|nr:helix-turn-helix transcriptional regulator [Planctomycetota bacterium]
MDPVIRNYFLGFIKIHILHHASKEPIYGLWFIEELKKHGYGISPGTLYPILHSMERDKFLQSYQEVVNGKVRKYYKTTSKGRKTLNEAKVKIQELINEIMEA